MKRTKGDYGIVTRAITYNYSLNLLLFFVINTRNKKNIIIGIRCNSELLRFAQTHTFSERSEES
ncbi:MAG: hypothetical protein K0S41_279 [Anaerocolumna sp.]|jgi:hypothetical protein|nr:hypothetical protein [Anaerocolumna sp.]